MNKGEAMGIVLVILTCVFVLAVLLWEFIEIPLNIFIEIRDDLENRNDRGKFKRPSEKYVSR